MLDKLITVLSFPAALIVEIAVHLIGSPNKYMIKRTLED